MRWRRVLAGGSAGRARGAGGLCLFAVLSCVAGAPGSDGLGAFVSPLYADHPLVGTVWSKAAGGPIPIAALERALGEARFVLLGETHDNADQHRLQARLIARLAARGRPAVVFEMLDPSQQAAVDSFLASGSRDPDAFAAEVGWERSGWPDFALYRPIFEVVLGAHLRIVAAGLPRGESLGPDAPERAERFGLAEALPPDVQEARIEEMFEAHCGLVPREALAPMVEMQRARDARMAYALIRAAGTEGRAVLVAGNAHVRDDAVPALLVRAGVPADPILSVGLLEVEPDQCEIADTPAARFDFAIFTPAAEREDPCEELRSRMRQPS